MTGKLTEVPGMDSVSVKKLAKYDNDDDKVTNTYQLFGKFLMLKESNNEAEKMVDPLEHAQNFGNTSKTVASQHTDRLSSRRSQKNALRSFQMYMTPMTTRAMMMMTKKNRCFWAF